MNILSAIFSGQTGFLKATESIADRASRIADPTKEVSAEDIVGIETDKSYAKANANVITISSNLMSEFIKDQTKSRP
ncbi:MAG: hypothetical protein JWQ35_1720 [Bacteriovoracaceae bacterium]|nr:hypothetical protein [Bacteriovoracaceae bacterium]